MSIEITPALLSDLRQKAEAATPGPWKWKNENGSFSVEGPIRKNRYYDSNYIAAANPAVVLALVAEVERLRGTQDELAETLSDVLRHTDLSGWKLGEQIEKDATDLLKRIKEVSNADQA